ncbi:MAG: prepilin peptidase [Candidatus Gracilibacteria bacterium]|nr:prepilin peptidase [Candidatus Gracilibacteria bacterium]
MTLYFVILFILGTVFGSFSTVLIERWKNGKSGIIMGRSECPKCNHTLSAWELIPLFSYIFQHGKCHNCHSKISPFYPIAEISIGIIFVIMGYAGMNLELEPLSVEMLIFLILGFITGIYILYDARYMEIPDQIMIPGIVGYILLIILGYFSPEMRTLIFDSNTYTDYSTLIFDHIRAAVIIYSFFYLQILIPGGFYLLRKKKSREFVELLVSYFLFPLSLIFGRIGKNETKESNEIDIPTWVGGGDLRIALFIGLTLGSIHTVSTLLFAYILGSLIGVILIVKRGRKNSQIAFGPFLGMGWFLSIVFYSDILNIFNI